MYYYKIFIYCQYLKYYFTVDFEYIFKDDLI